MSDNLQPNLFGTNDTPPAIIHNMTQNQLRRDQALGAYRNNIALPDVAVVSRYDCSQPKVLGEDGKEMTFERRQELMKGKKPICTIKGDRAVVNMDQDFRTQFDGQIDTERLGKSAEENRPPMRVVQPKILEIVPDAGAGNTVPPGTWIPETQQEPTAVSECAYSVPSVTAVSQLFAEAKLCVQTIVHLSGPGRIGCRKIVTSQQSATYIAELLSQPHIMSLWGISLWINDELKNEVRFYGDLSITKKYAALFMELPLVMDFGVDVSAETTTRIAAIRDTPPAQDTPHAEHG